MKSRLSKLHEIAFSFIVNYCLLAQKSLRISTDTSGLAIKESTVALPFVILMFQEIVTLHKNASSPTMYLHILERYFVHFTG